MRFRRRSNSQEAAAWYSVDPRYERLLDRGAMWQGRVITGILLAGWWFAWAAARDVLAYVLLAYLVLDQLVRAGFGGRLLGYRVDQVGLHEVRYGRRDRSYPWETIDAVEESADELLVRTTVGELRIPRDMPAAFHLAQQLRRGGGERAEAGAELTAAQVEAWLGLRPGEVWTSGLLSRERFLIGAGLVGAGLVLMPFASPVEVWMLSTALAWVVMLLPQVAQRVEISAWGVRRGRRWAAAWDDVIGSQLVDGDCTVRTAHGELLIPVEYAKQVHETVQRILDAKRDGAVLPRLSDLPDTALSRAVPQDGSAARGLSLSEEDSP